MGEEQEKNKQDEIEKVKEKYRNLFREYENLTIKEFIKKLKLDPKDPSFLKSISPKDAVDILVMIALSPIPFGPVLKRSVVNKMGKNPKEITFQKVIQSIESISSNDIKNERLLLLIKNTLKKTNLSLVEDPFNSKIKLKDYPVTAQFIRIPIFLKVAESVGLNKEILENLKEEISNEEHLLSFEDEQLANNFQIELKKVEIIKSAINLAKRGEINPKLAVILSQNFKIKDLALLNVEEIKEKIKKTTLDIKESEYNTLSLKKIQEIIKLQNPKLIFLEKVLLDLKLKTPLKTTLDEHEIRSIDDLTKTIADSDEKKIIFDIITSKIKSKKKIETLKAYIRLSKISKNFELIKFLIESNYTSSFDITHIPFFKFQNLFIDKASKEELKEIYYRAHRKLAKDITLRSLKTLTSQRAPLDYLVSKSGSSPQIVERKNLNLKNEKEVVEN